MAATKPTRRRSSAKTGVKGAPRALERRLAKLQEQLRAERARHNRQVAAAKRAADRQTTALVREIAVLRHHEARAETLARLEARNSRISLRLSTTPTLRSLEVPWEALSLPRWAGSPCAHGWIRTFSASRSAIAW